MITDNERKSNEKKLARNEPFRRKQHISDNLLVYPGRKAMHIFDMVSETWILNSKEIGHQY